MAEYQSPYYYTLKGDEVSQYVDRQDTATPRQENHQEAPPLLQESLLRKALEGFLPKQKSNLAHKTIIRDAVIPKISQILDRTDHYLPYNQANLPDVIKGSYLRDQFLKLQEMVRCRQEDIAELEMGGKHLSLPGNAATYFLSVVTLGQGRFVRVDKVRSLQTAELYARKQILRGESALQDQDNLTVFEKELKSLKKLSHHVVKLVGSYTDPTSLGIIMSPIADMDLQAYLNSKGWILNMATALAYIHGKNIRHKDIKPNNVLVKGDRVLLSDFGTSRVCLDGHLTTRGGSPEGTPRYWTPEDRNTASDIWSLGCVFLEMATTLFGYSHSDMLKLYSEHGTENCSHFSPNQGGMEAWIKHLSKDVHNPDNAVLRWAASMLQFDPQERPTAAQLRGRILDVRPGVDYICQCCSTRAGSETGICYPPFPLMDTRDTAVRFIDHRVGNDVLSSRPPTPSPEHRPSEVPSERISAKNRNVKSPSRNNVRDLAGLLRSSQDRRPKPGLPSKDTFIEAEQTEFVVPDPLRLPSFDSYEAPLPNATLVPSYILTGSNRMLEREVRNDLDSDGLCNVFVYGRLMFPSVLHAIASQSIDGVYAPSLQRRIYPVSADWNKANFSIQRAGEIMTPAMLESHDRWQPSRLDCAAIERSTVTQKILERCKQRKQRKISPPGHVFGHLIAGLKMEAVRYLDLLLASTEKNLGSTRPVKKDDGTDDFSKGATEEESPLVRKRVTVQVKLLSGETVESEAYASRKAATRLLLQCDADVFATDPVHVNALYQAVRHADYAVAEMLLEHAAWLVEDWAEVRDLAAETGDDEMVALLRQYDIRGMYRQQQQQQQHRKEIEGGVNTGRQSRGLVSAGPGEDEDEGRVVCSNTAVFTAVIKKMAAVQAMDGKWRGRKGVAVTLAALNAGAPPSILRYLRSAVNPVKMLINELSQADSREEGSGIFGLGFIK
ncbi:hypothetical protein PG994_003991 [Apiospora phragmitis]|uniref:non-specific serine/threonine protein kinase n=1 Tax=Apiospora phragmitis TaxID=2905665 RepID=A0ABR1VZP2_9PEZI